MLVNFSRSKAQLRDWNKIKRSVKECNLMFDRIERENVVISKFLETLVLRKMSWI